MAALRDDLGTPTRWPALDGVRGIAVLAVVIYHAVRLAVLGEGRVPADGYTAAWWPIAGWRLAVDAFFVLSGFLITESWRNARGRSEGIGSACVAYVRRRAARIGPAYWVSLVVFVPLVAPHLLRSPADLALLAGVQQYLRPGLPSEVNVVYWSLTTEVHFYVLAPFVVLALARFGARRVVPAAFVAAIAWQAVIPDAWPRSLIGARIDQFVIGASLAGVVAVWARRERHWLVDIVRRRGAVAVLGIALAVLAAWQGAVLDGVGRGAPSLLLHPLTGVTLALLLLRLLTAESPTFFERPGLRLAGLVSYGAYLSHYPVLQLGYRWTGIGPGEPTAPIVTIAVTAGLIVATFLIGAMSYVVIERRFIGRTGSAARVPADANLRRWRRPVTSTSFSASSA